MADDSKSDFPGDFMRLRDVDSSFQNRSNFIFDRLGTLEPSSETSTVKAEEEAARKQQGNANKGRKYSPRGGARRLPARVPQHVLSPQKWTKYSLENDGSEDFRGMNAHNINKHAAHSFLSDLKKRKSVEKNSSEKASDTDNDSLENVEVIRPKNANRSSVVKSETVDIKSDKVQVNEQRSKTNLEKVDVLNIDDDSKLLFKKPSPKIDMTSSSSTTTNSWRGGAFIMPEYVVGAAKTKASPRDRKSSGVKPIAGNTSVNLEHLEDESVDSVTSGIEEQKMGKQRGKRNIRKRKLEEGKDYQ